VSHESKPLFEPGDLETVFQVEGGNLGELPALEIKGLGRSRRQSG
jgi:hypothetical protein